MSDLNGDNNVDISPEQTQTEETNGPISESKSTENETKQTEKVVNESSPPQEKNGVSENSIPKPQKPKDGLKVDILLKATGDAPIMKKKKWTVERSKRISWVSDFIKKYIKSDPSESLFLYVNQAFAPSLDTDIGSVFDCFGSDGKLVLHYCRTQAWG